MNKVIKIAISVVLCIAISIGIMLPSFAAEKKTAFIMVSGMNTMPLMCGEERIFGPEGSVVASSVMNSVPPILQFLADKDYEKLGDGLIPAVKPMLEKLSCNPDGTSKYDVTTGTFPDRVSEFASTFENATNDEFALVHAGMDAFGAENTYFFNFDWRLSPLDHADDLNDFIQMVKSKDDYDRIVLAAYSMGGTIVDSYLYKYGSSELDTIALCSTAFQGTTSVGTLFTGEFDFSMSALMRRFSELARNNFLENFINGVNKALNASGVNAKIDDFANTFSYELMDQLYSGLITPVFGYMAGLWALCDSDRYEDAKAYMLGDDADAGFVEKIDEYKYNVQDHAFDLLKEAEKDSLIYITAQYNRQGLPVSVDSATSNNDNLIDTKFESGGAICSLLGETLGDDYTQAVDCGHNHISYDNNIDASTCMFPEQTWFVRDMMHVDYPYGEPTDFLIWLMQSEEQLTVHSDARYPQFILYKVDDNSMSPLDENSTKKTTVDIIFDILGKIIDFISNAFKMIVK